MKVDELTKDDALVLIRALLRQTKGRASLNAHEIHRARHELREGADMAAMTWNRTKRLEIWIRPIPVELEGEFSVVTP